MTRYTDHYDMKVRFEHPELSKEDRRKLRKNFGSRKCSWIQLNGSQCPVPSVYVKVVKIDDDDKIVSQKLMRARFCMNHLPEKFYEGGYPRFGGRTSTSGLNEANKRNTHKPLTMMRQMVEEQVRDILQPYIDGLSATKHVVVGNGKFARAMEVPDTRARIQAAEALFDRVYGKPKQTTELQGGIEQKIIEVPQTKERQTEVARILAEAGAVPDPRQQDKVDSIAAQATAASNN